MSAIKEHDKKQIVGTYARFDLAIVSGKSATCWDEEGKSYLDFTSGIGVNSLGYCDDEWVQVVSAQAGRLQHTSNLYYTAPCVELADRLCEATGYDKVFFGNSGAEANEAAIKVARKYSFDKYGEGRNKIVCLRNSFHGRTVTTLSATGQDVFHNYFFPFTEGFVFAEANDLVDVVSKLDDSICAVMFECVQGEGGVIPLDEAFLQGLISLCEKKDILTIADEVQTGVGRTGTFLASEQFGIKPDITTLAKGLGGGLPIGAVLCNEKTSGVLSYGDHGSTFGGNPVVCAGANLCVNRIASEVFLEEVRRKSLMIKDALMGIREVESLNGLGLMVGIKLRTQEAKEIAQKCLKSGLMVLTAKEKIRLLPPLNITDDELLKGLEILRGILLEYEEPLL